MEKEIEFWVTFSRCEQRRSVKQNNWRNTCDNSARNWAISFWSRDIFVVAKSVSKYGTLLIFIELRAHFMLKKSNFNSLWNQFDSNNDYVSFDDWNESIGGDRMTISCFWSDFTVPFFSSISTRFLSYRLSIILFIRKLRFVLCAFQSCLGMR